MAVYNEDDFTLPEDEEMMMYGELPGFNDKEEPVPYYRVNCDEMKEVKKEFLVQQMTKGLCVICSQERARYVMDPCGHACLCEQCNYDFKQSQCPYCKGEIESKIKLV